MDDNIAISEAIEVKLADKEFIHRPIFNKSLEMSMA